MIIYTVGCWKCREFHAYERIKRAEDCIKAMQNKGCLYGGNHDNLGIVSMDSERVPMWEEP